MEDDKSLKRTEFWIPVWVHVALTLKADKSGMKLATYLRKLAIENVEDGK